MKANTKVSKSPRQERSSGGVVRNSLIQRSQELTDTTPPEDLYQIFIMHAPFRGFANGESHLCVKDEDQRGEIRPAGSLYYGKEFSEDLVIKAYDTMRETWIREGACTHIYTNYIFPWVTVPSQHRKIDPGDVSKPTELKITAEQLKEWNCGLVTATSYPYHLYSIELLKWCRENNISADELIATHVKKMLDLMKDLGGKKVWWESTFSQTMAVNWPESFSSRKEAYKWYSTMRNSFQANLLERVRFPTAKEPWYFRLDDRAGAFEEYDRRLSQWWYPQENRVLTEEEQDFIKRRPFMPYDYLREKLGLDPKDYNIIASTPRIFDIHYFHEWGNKLVMVNDTYTHCSNQILFAFARGAAKQYGGYWGYYEELQQEYLDRDIKGTVNGIATAYNERMEQVCGLSPSRQLNIWIAAYMSAANMIGHQKSATSYYILSKEGALKMTPMGKAAFEFGQFSLKRHPNRGKTYVPVALMLEHDHGWEQERWAPVGKPCPRFPYTAENVVWGCIPYEDGDYMIGNFFQAAFPGYIEEYHVCPGGSVAEYVKLTKSGVDLRKYENPHLTTSTWGDSFDVVLENCPLEVLKQYKAVMLLGRVKLGGELREKLEAYVQQGGTLFLNIGQIKNRGKDLEEFLGIAFSGVEKGAVSSVCRICGRKHREDLYRYEKATPRTSRVEAVNEYGDPLILRNRIGQGEVVFATIYYLQTHSHDNLLGIAADVIGHFMDRFALADVEGPPIEYIVNQAAEGVIVTLINSEDRLWEGVIRVDKPDAEHLRVSEWWSDEMCDFDVEDGKVTIRVQVPKFESKIYAIGKFA